MSEHVIELPLQEGDVVAQVPVGGGVDLTITGVNGVGDEIIRTYAHLPAGVKVEEGDGKVVVRIPVEDGGELTVDVEGVE